MIKTLIKFLFAGGIIYWLFQDGKIDLGLVKKSVSETNNWIYALILIMIQVFICSLRWRALLQIKSKKKLAISKVFSVTWIGLFFNSFLPGAVTGDLVKLVYAKDLDKDLSKTYLVMTALLDRIIGLVGLVFLMGLFTTINYNKMISLSPEMGNLMMFNLFLFLGCIVFLISLFLPKKLQGIFLNISKKIPLLGNKVHKTLEQVWIIGEDKKTLCFTLILSMIAQLLGVLAFWTISSPYYGVELPLTEVFTFIPIGLITVAIPISPMGLGVGHVVFDKLFMYAGVAGGANFFNLFFLCAQSINITGFIPYVLFGKKHSLKEAEDFEDTQVLE